MQVQQIRNDSTAFNGLSRDVNVPKHIFDALSETPTVKKFGEKFNATLSVDTFLSSQNNNKVQYALKINDIEPKGFIAKLQQMFSGNKTESIKLKTHATSEEGLVASVSKMKSNTLMHIYEK